MLIVQLLGQQMIELRLIGEFVDPRQVN